MFLLHSVSILLLLLAVGGGVNAIPLHDLVTNLPLVDGPLPSPQFSGYLDATDGCDTKLNGPYCKIHYWFILAEEPEEEEEEEEGEGGDVIGGGGVSEDDDHFELSKTALQAPTIVWFNGGPGASSVLGLVQELGPLLINGTGNGFFQNPYSWTKLPANLLILEAPLGVGYSYCANQIMYNQTCINTDQTTSTLNLAALVDFFSASKFPELRQNELYLTGESYAGVYVPTVAKQILDYNNERLQEGKLNLVGLGVGDPCIDNDTQHDSMDHLWYSHKYGLIDDDTFDLLWNHCGKIWGDVSKMPSSECKVALYKFLLSSSFALANRKHWDGIFLDKYSLYSPVSKVDDEFMSDYMTQLDVQKALHVEESLAITAATWPHSTQGFHYTKEYNACNYNPDKQTSMLNESMIELYRDIVPKLQNVFVYNGNVDPTISYEGTKLAIDKIGFPQLGGGSGGAGSGHGASSSSYYRPWFYNKTGISLDVMKQKSSLFGPDLTLQPMGVQFGGEVINYEHNLTLITVHGSGHLVPQSRPQIAFHILTKLLRKQPLLSPLLPTDDELLERITSNDEFTAFMNEWMKEAKSPAYLLDSVPGGSNSQKGGNGAKSDKKSNIDSGDRHGYDDFSAVTIGQKNVRSRHDVPVSE